MTEYGRGSGSEPWHPDDPLFGDRVWGAGAGPGDQTGAPGPYQPQYPAQQDHYAGQHDPYGQPHSHGSPGGYDPYGQHPAHDAGHYAGGPSGGQPYDSGHYGQQHHPQGHFADPRGGQHDPYYGQQASPGAQGHGWDQGGHGGPGHTGHGGQAGQSGHGGYDAHSHQGYDGYPPQGYHPQGYDQQGYSQQGYDQRYDQHPPPADRGHGAPPPAGRRAPGPDPGPDPETGWDPGPDQGESDFFASRDGDEDEDEPPPRRGRGGGRSGGRGGDRPKRRRGGCACLVVSLGLVAGAGAAVYFGYDFYQSRFGDAPDYSGEGSGEVQVEIPPNASLSDMGTILRDAGVVKSHDAFVAAADGNEAAMSIQPGVYTLREEMSAEAAVAMLTDPAAQNTFTVPEGMRATQIYALIDEQLGLAEGSTEEVAEEADLGLPEWAEGDPEGFLFPARYDVGDGMEPEELLREMVERAEAEFAQINLESHAAELDKTPRELVILASLIQAEAQEDEEFGKVSQVIYNRLDQDMRLQFDSTINYALGRSTLDVTIEETRLDSPYNTYQEYGLPPGPIANPGHQAFEAAVEPTEGDWLFFVTVKPGDTRFTDDPEEHERNVQDFNAEQARQREQQGGDA